MSEQPNALRLAKWLDAMPSSGYALPNQAATELRRLHEVNQELLAALKLALEALESCSAGDYSAGHVIHPSFDVDAVNKAIEAIDALAEQPAQRQEPVAIEYWLQDTMESGRWVTTDNMAKATAEKMLSGEYGDVYPQGRIVEPSPPASKPWVGLTQKDIDIAFDDTQEGGGFDEFARAIEAKLKERNA